MDLPIAAPQIPVSDDFPHQILPFPHPSSSRLLCSNTLPLIPPQDIISDPLIPPPQLQKLRPIRSASNSPASSRLPNRGLAKLRGLGSPLAVRDGWSEHFDSSVEVTAADSTENYVLTDGVNNGYLPGNDEKNVDAVAESSILDYRRIMSEEELSSSSGCSSDDSVADMKDSIDRKRKKRKKQKMEHILEKMVRKVMERQEEMHRQLIEMIEKREADTQVREEAWKQREMERKKKDEKLRAQETSRSLHVISLIENLSGHEIPIPQTIRRQYMEEDGGDSGLATKGGRNEFAHNGFQLNWSTDFDTTGWPKWDNINK